MIEEDKNLLIQDLCGRLPYGVKCSHPYGIGKLESIAKEEHGIDVTFETPDDTYYSIEDCKPYLFPLSSMTEEQKEEIDKITNGSVAISENFFYDLCNCSKIYHFDVIAVIDWFNKNHFDYRGLIEKGLAINVIGLSIY